MTVPLSSDLRLRLVRAVDEGSSARAAAARFDVSASAAIKLMQRVRATGSAAPAKIGGYRKPLRADHDDLLRELGATRKSVRLAKIREELLTRGIDPGCLRKIRPRLRHLGLSYKKRREGPPAGSCRRCPASSSVADMAALYGPEGLCLSR